MGGKAIRRCPEQGGHHPWYQGRQGPSPSIRRRAWRKLLHRPRWPVRPRCLVLQAGCPLLQVENGARDQRRRGYAPNVAVTEAAWGLARYARICQEAGLVPIVEPEILMDGEHTIEKTIEVQTQVVAEVYRACIANGVYLPGSLLKPSMTVPGVECKEKASPQEVAKATIDVLEASVPSKVPGVTFLSGGLAEEDASIFLNTMNTEGRVGPWSLTFSFSRAMQSSCLKIWDGMEENKEKAQAQLKARAQANSEANLGKYKAGSQPSLSESLYQKNYVY